MSLRYRVVLVLLVHETRRRIEPHLPDEPGAARARQERLRPDDGPNGYGAEKRRMRRPFWVDIAMVVATTLVVFNGVPMAIEQSGGPCRAVEAKVGAAFMPGGSSPIGLAMMQALVNASAGSVALAIARRDHPDLPPSLACSTLYWRTLLDPGSVGRMRDAAAAPAPQGTP